MIAPPVESYSEPSSLLSRELSLAPREPAPPPDKRERLLYGDPLRVLGSVAVIALHLATQITEDVQAVGSARWWFAALCDGATRWAVPAFLMLSGALLLEPSRTETTAAFYRKRWHRMGPVIFFWCLFYAVWGQLWEPEPTPLRSALRYLVLGEPYYHLHFLFALPGLYFLTPMLRVYTRHASPRQFQLLTAAVLSVTVLAGIIQELRNRGISESVNAFTRFMPFLGYYLTGYALRGVVLSRRGIVGAVVGFLVSVLLYAVGTAWLVARFPSHPFAFYFLTQYSLTRVVGGICVFLLAASVFRHGIRAPRVNWVVSRLLAPASLGVYLIHPIFVDSLQLSGNPSLKERIWLGLPLTTAGIWAASVAATLLLRQLPLVRRLVG